MFVLMRKTGAHSSPQLHLAQGHGLGAGKLGAVPTQALAPATVALADT